MAIQLDGTTGISTSGNITVAGALVVGTFAPTSLSASGNVTSGNLNTTGALSVGGNSVIAGDLTVVGNASLSGNIIGDKITNGTTSVEIPVANGNVSFTVGGTNVVIVSTTGEYVTGEISAGGNITGSNLNATNLSLIANVISAINSTFAITTSANVSANNVIATNHINASGNISGGNVLPSGQLSAIGNVTGGNLLTSGIVSTPGNITGANILTGGLISAGGNITTITQISASGNITTGGTLSSSGNIVGNNLNAAGLSLSSNVVSDLNSTSNITTTANIAGGYFLGNGSLLTGIDATSIQNGTSNVRVVSSGGDVAIGIGGTSNVAVFSTTGEYVTGLISATGNVTGNNIFGQNFFANGIFSTSGNVIANGIISTSGNVIALAMKNSNGNSSIEFNDTGTVSANIILYQAGANGTAIVRIGENTIDPGNFGLYATGQLGATANIVSLSNISATANIIGNNLNAAGLSLSSNVVSALNSTSNITTTANITGGNVLTGGLISATGNITGSNILTGGLVSATGDITGGNLTTGYITFNYDISGSGNITGGNLDLTYSGGCARGNLTGGNISMVGNITGGNILTAGVVSTGGNIIVGYSLSAGGSISATGTITSADTITGANLATGGTASATGNITGGNVLTGGLISATGNITSAANVSGGNILTGGVVSSTGNLITGANVVATANVIGGNISTGGLITATGNVDAGNLRTSGLVTATGNVTGNNITTGGLITATGNIQGGNLIATTAVVTANIIGSADVAITTTANANIYLQPNGTGNIVLATTFINSVASPVQSTDAATKQYVDDAVSAGLTIHTPVYVESPTNLVATYADGGTIQTVTTISGNKTLTFGSSPALLVNDVIVFSSTTNGITAGTAYFVYSTNGSNQITLSLSHDGTEITTLTNGTGLTIGSRANSGVGATLTNAAANAAIQIDGVTLTSSQRVLVYQQTSAFENGVYTVTAVGNATARWELTRSTDTNTYGPKSTSQMDIGDYFYVQAGDTGAGESYVVTAPTGTIIFGTTNIAFTQFGASQVYTANTSAGLSLIGTVFNAKVDNVSTAFDLNGNIVVKASANLTTPNIGAATGTSLSTTGNIEGGNLLTSGLISSTGTITGSSLIGSVVTASGNVTGGNVLTGGLISATSTITSAANITGANLLTGGLISVTGNITGGNLRTAGLISATGAITGAAITGSSLTVSTGNITGGNLILSGAIIDSAQLDIQTSADNANIVLTPNGTGNVNTGANLSVTGNVQGGNLRTVGLISATGNITGGNILGGANVNATTHTGTTVSVSANITGGNILTGGLISATGNITGGNFVGTLNGSGANVTSISATNISSGTLAQARLANSAVTLGDTALTLGSTVTTVAGLTSVTSTSFVGTLTGSASFAGTVTTAAQPNITSVGTLSGLTINNATTAITNGAANGVGNIGTSANSFNTLFAKATSAQYADLAESYAADAKYASGTVLTFGGNQEVTIATESSDVRVAGVVSTNPAHVMNASLNAEHVAVVALTGRVPTSVAGTVRKGDMMVSAGNGAAQACATPAMGTVIGKALENFDGESGVIEIVVGRL